MEDLFELQVIFLGTCASSQTNSFPASCINEAKQVWAWLVLGWETSWEN